MLSIFQTRLGCAVVAAAIAVIATFIMTARYYDQSLQVAASCGPSHKQARRILGARNR